MQKWDVDFAELSRAPPPEDSLRLSTKWSFILHHSHSSPPNRGGVSGTVEGAVEKNILNPKLPNKDCNQPKRQMSRESTLTEGETEADED